MGQCQRAPTPAAPFSAAPCPRLLCQGPPRWAATPFPRRRPRLLAPAPPPNSPCSWTTAPRRRRRPANCPGRSRCRRRNSFGLAHCARAALGGGPTRGPRDDHNLRRAPRRLSVSAARPKTVSTPCRGPRGNHGLLRAPRRLSASAAMLKAVQLRPCVRLSAFFVGLYVFSAAQVK